MNLPQYEGLDVAHFQRIFDNMSESYKLFWFRAILELVREGKTVLSYDEILNRMIAEAWYMVSEYKLNLGPADNLERLVLYAQQLTGMKSCEKRETIIQRIVNSEEKGIVERKKVLIQNVPYRLQAPFLTGEGNSFYKVPLKQVAEQLNQRESLLYKFVVLDGLKSVIEVRDGWADYLRINGEVIEGWLQYKMIDYLQRRNPSVPGISLKLAPPEARDLTDVQKLWHGVMKVTAVHEIYGGQELESHISIDHFVPWSYVAHDELWNLSPTTQSINSQKSNGLPTWDTYFREFAELQFLLNDVTWNYDGVHKLFDACAKKHLNTEGLQQKLYRKDIAKTEFENQLAEVMLPVYQSAQNAGFNQWEYKE